MKVFTSLILALAWNIPLVAQAVETQSLNFSKQIFIAQNRSKPSGGGNRNMSKPSGGGNRNISKPSGGGNNINLNSERNGSNRVSKPTVNNETNRNKVNNISNNSNNRNFNLNNEQNYSNRINRNNVGNTVNRNNVSNTVNRNNIGNTVNHNRVVVNNPRGWNSWGWHGGSPWYPSNNYWGGGFWGPFAVGAVTGAVTGAAITAASQPQYVVVQSGTPGYTLLNNYSLTQTKCSNNVVIINGPSSSVICAIPSATVPAGTYSIETSTLTLIPQ